jgi:branched-chain amino acid transport system permease protein
VVFFTFKLDLFRSTGTLVFALAVLLVLTVAPKGILGYLGDGARLVNERVLRR